MPDTDYFLTRGREELVGLLAAQGLEAARRPLRVLPQGLEATFAHGSVTIGFSLPAGAFATTVLAEIVELSDQSLPEWQGD